ncbi:MAG: hypothetical protein WAQ27_01500 [Candidatus Microsaccharimonas sp.]
MANKKRLQKRTKRIVLFGSVPIIVAMVVIGVLAVVRAAPSSFEVETGTKSSNAEQVSDATASGGSAVKFKATGGSQPTGCPATKRTITASDVTNLVNSGYPANTQVFVPGGPDPWGGCFPGAGNTGIPSGTTLTAYTGSCNITTPNTVIDSKTITCGITVTASNVIIRNSKITNGNLNVNSGSLSIVDTEIDLGNNPDDEGVKGSNLTITRANMYGGKRQVWCSSCTVQDSYLHDQLADPSGLTHESAARADQGTTLLHNTLLCNAPNYPPDAGCSANQTGYPDFSTTKNNRFEKNFYMATTGGYCSYGGQTNGKPYSNDATNATNIVSLNNVFQRGTNANDRTSIALTDKRRYTCGYYGVTTAYDSTKSGFQFTGNMWDDGLLFSSDTTYPYGAFY